VISGMLMMKKKALTTLLHALLGSSQAWSLIRSSSLFSQIGQRWF
jgi:hypothetical protein